MKIPNRFIVSTKDPEVTLSVTSLRKAMKTARKISKMYDAEATVVDALTGAVHYIYYVYVDKQVTKV